MLPCAQRAVVAVSESGSASKSRSACNKNELGNGSVPGSAGFSTVAVHTVCLTLPAFQMAWHISADRLAASVPRSASICWSGELSGSPSMYCLFRTGLGNAYRPVKRMREKVEHGYAEWYPLSLLSCASLRSLL